MRSTRTPDTGTNEPGTNEPGTNGPGTSETMLVRLLLVECPELGEDDEGGHSLRKFARVVEALAQVCPWIDPVRPGVCTLPIKGPMRYFGDEQAVLGQVASAVESAMGGGVESAKVGRTESAMGGGVESAKVGHTQPQLGVAEGLFAAVLAARASVVVPPGGTARFLASWPVDVLGDRDLADLLVRLGLPTLGDFAALPAAHVLARFGSAGVHCHRVARAQEGELAGYRVPGMAARLVTALGRDLALTEHQPGFWGGTSVADERAAEALTALQRRLGPEAVTVPVLGGGRGPGDRCRLVPWRPGAQVAQVGQVGQVGEQSERQQAQSSASRGGRKPQSANKSKWPFEQLPWPGRVPPPAPALVPANRPPAELVDAAGTPVGVTARGLLTGRPAQVSISGGPWTAITGWSAPWPLDERWWSRGRRRAARLQVLAADGRAYLLLLEQGRWRVEAAYV